MKHVVTMRGYAHCMCTMSQLALVLNVCTTCFTVDVCVFCVFSRPGSGKGKCVCDLVYVTILQYYYCIQYRMCSKCPCIQMLEPTQVAHTHTHTHTPTHTRTPDPLLPVRVTMSKRTHSTNSWLRWTASDHSRASCC